MIAATAPATVSAAGAAPPRTVRLWLWLPLTPLFWLLAPLALILAPLSWLAPPRVRPRNPYALVLVLGRLLLSLGGTVVDVDTPDTLVRLRIL